MSQSELSAREVRLHRARLLKQAGPSATASESLPIVDELPPNLIQETLLDGLEALRNQDLAAARASFDSVLQEDPASFEGRLLQAVVSLLRNQPREAEIGLTACLAQRPQFGWGYILRGKSLARSDRHVEATRDFEAALRLRLSEIARRVAEASLAELNTSGSLLPQTEMSFRNCMSESQAAGASLLTVHLRTSSQEDAR